MEDDLNEKAKKKKNCRCRGRLRCVVGRGVEFFFEEKCIFVLSKHMSLALI